LTRCTSRDCLRSELLVVPVLLKVEEVLYTENNVLEILLPVIICNDIHGQVYELFDRATDCQGIGSHKVLFMGEYVHCGYFSMETFAYLIALKLRHPGPFYLLRGNHECRQVNQMYGFCHELQVAYGHSGIWSLCNDMFDLLPVAAPSRSTAACRRRSL
jgi:hypothetical protein